MKYTNRLKGSVSQALVRSLFSHSGMIIAPLGIEETIREVAELPLEQYVALDLPVALRKLPDFFVTNFERTQHWLVEVKYRSAWSDECKSELGEALRIQAETWNPLVAIIFLGQSDSHFPNQPNSWIRAVRLRTGPGGLEFWDARTTGGFVSWGLADWLKFERVQDVFPALNSRDIWSSDALHSTLQVSKNLTSV